MLILVPMHVCVLGMGKKLLLVLAASANQLLHSEQDG